MAIEPPISEKQEETIHRARTHTPNVLADYIGEFYVDLDDLAVQEIAHHSLWENSHNNQSNASNGGSRPNPEIGQSSGGGNHSVNNNILSLDEALAQQCELLENGNGDVPLVALHLSEDGEIILEASNVDGRSSSTEPPTQVTRQDSIDVDRMSYEQLQSLEEGMGSERRGLSDERISLLKKTEHRCRFFSKEGKTECVICTSHFGRKRLITLGCQHCYHSRCILRWLKESKACPICKEEVFGRTSHQDAKI